MEHQHTERCKRIASAVETLSQTETEELFRIIHKHRFDYTRNNHGVFINLSWVPDAVLTQMEEYINFCHQSKHELKKYESICDALNTKLATTASDAIKNKKDAKLLARASSVIPATTTKDVTGAEEEAVTDCSEAAEKSNKVSASMRFYLFKKKYNKMAVAPNNVENDLSHDEYVITH